jgi:hypothetical protein
MAGTGTSIRDTHILMSLSLVPAQPELPPRLKRREPV